MLANIWECLFNTMPGSSERSISWWVGGWEGGGGEVGLWAPGPISNLQQAAKGKRQMASDRPGQELKLLLRLFRYRSGQYWRSPEVTKGQLEGITFYFSQTIAFISKSVTARKIKPALDA